jgi:hypothetical protein
MQQQTSWTMSRHGTDALQSMHDEVDEQQNRYKAELGTIEYLLGTLT